MKQNKILLSVAVFILMMTGCSSLEHFNVIKDISGKNVLVEDVVTHQERIFIMTNSQNDKMLLEFSRPGDTVIVQSPYYKDFVLKKNIRTHMFFYLDSIDVRMNKFYFEQQKQKLFNDKVR